MMRSLTYLAAAIAVWSSGALAANFDVQVGQGGNVYTPDHVSGANPGDTVTFHFTGAHTVSQGSFAFPCAELEDGFDSGVHTSGTYVVAVNNTHPIWIHCTQPGHCPAGMVFAINAVSDAQLAQYKTNAQSSNSAGSTTFGPSWSTPAYPTPTTVTVTVTPANGAAYTTTYASYPDSAAPTPAAAPVEHVVDVGVNAAGVAGLNFTPPFIQAAVDDVVVFTFHNKNHTATQSSFSNPCVSNGGFDSGFMFIANNTAPLQFRVTVNDTAPIWVFCKQPVGSHCGNGMVFAVNPDEESANTFEAFQELAKRINGTGGSGSSGSGSSGSGSGSGSGSDSGSGHPGAGFLRSNINLGVALSIVLSVVAAVTIA